MFGPSTPGRDAEYTAFVRSASASLTRTAWLLTGDADLAAELVQESLVRTYLAWRRVRHGEATAYARRVLVNLSIDRWRSRKITTVELTEVPVSGAEGRVADRDQVARMLATLPAGQRRVIVLRYYNDLSEAEIADCLGISPGAVKSAASRGLAALRVHFAPALEGDL
jgi:RNA polymerase sigma-70 factor (sigma-E family)